MTTQAAPAAANLDQDENLPDVIKRIAAAMECLTKKGMLNRKAVVALIKDDTGIPKKQIERVLKSLSALAATYTTKE